MARQELIGIQTRTVTRDSFGGEVERWIDSDLTWASVAHVSAAERFGDGSDRVQATRVARFTIRRYTAQDDITEANNRVVFRNRAWDITGVTRPERRASDDLTITAEFRG